MAETNAVALITGASGGIGAELARLFAEDGINLLLIARSKDKLVALQAELESRYGVEVTVLPTDLTSQGAAEAVGAFIEEQGLRIQTLVCNAGFGDWALFKDADCAKLQAMLQLNVVSLTALERILLPMLIEEAKKRGKKQVHILNVASVAGFMPGPKMAVYYASKAYVKSLSEALSVECKPAGVTVTALCPGPVKTDFWNTADAGKSSLLKKLSFADSRSIARTGYSAMKRGKVLVLPGLLTKIFVLLASLLPRSWVRTLVYWIQK
ncbi:MAG: SDR family oxidoreductase [Treponema sp.]|nr:SDR family oxidoreductase [Treponema sp.]